MSERNPSPAEAKMVAGATYRHRYSGRDFVFVGKAAADMDGLNVAAGRPIAVFQNPDGTLFACEWALAADGRFALTVAPKATETPGLREALEDKPVGWTRGYGMFTTDFELAGKWARCCTVTPLYARAALSATPQPVAVPDDGAGRDEAVAIYKALGDFVAIVEDDPSDADIASANEAFAATHRLASALSAERAAHEQTRFDRDVWHKSFETVTARAEAAEAEVACLRKAAEDAVAHIRGHFPGAAAEFEAVYDRADARSSREAR